MKQNVHVHARWPMAPTEHARWEGGARAVLAISGYEINADGHYCVPTASAPIVTIPRENVIAITPRQQQ